MDNAATSFPKPAGVNEAMVRYATELGASAGRGGYAEAVETGRLINECRERIARLFNCEYARQVVFTLNCTDALNTAIKGLIDPAKKSHVICTASDHNSILRPINALVERGWTTSTVIPIDPQTGLVDVDDVRRAIQPNTKLIAITHTSNVTGAVQPIRLIGQLARECAVPFIVDAAQSAGHVPIDVQADCIDLLAAPGHKALFGPPGTGFLYLRPGMEKMVRPLREGGTGSNSEHPTQPSVMPDRYESGSHNSIGLIGLNEGVKWVAEQTVEKIHRLQLDLVRTFIDGVQSIENLEYFGPHGVRNRIGVFSVRIEGIAPDALATRLETEFGILTRAGLHCAPHVHEALGTSTTGGTTRLSFGAFLSTQDVKYATDALAQIASSVESPKPMQCAP